MKNIVTGEVKIWHEVSAEQTEYVLNQGVEGIASSKITVNFLNLRNLIALTYLALGIFLLITVFLLIDIYLMHLKIETAVVSVPIQSMVAPMPGFIREVLVRPGEEVKKGNILMKIENLDLERDLQLARVQVEDSSLNISYLQNLLINEEKKLQVYKNIGFSRLASAQAMVDISKQKLLTSAKNLERIKILHRKHYISDSEYDQVYDKYKSEEINLESTKAQRDVETSSLDAVGSGVYFTGAKLEGIVKDLNAEIEAASRRLNLNKSRVNVYDNLVHKLTLVAPFDCKVNQILKSAGTTTDNIKPIILLEQTQINKNIIAYLTQNEISHVGIGETVKIYIPAIGRKYLGHVLSIDRTAGFMDEIKAQFRWRDLQLDRSAMVVIEIDQDKNKFNHDMISGMPAIVYFKRKFTSF